MSRCSGWPSTWYVWRVGKRSYSCAISVVTHDSGLTAGRVREQLARHEEIVHATIEIQCGPATAEAEG